MGLFFIFMALVVFGTIICIILDNIKIELKYRNTLLEEQNEILLNNKK
jgi:hypothetical protein